MTEISRKKFLYLIIYLQLCSYCLFMMGFFPVKKSLSESANFQNYSLEQHDIVQPQKQYDRVAIILIDALRTDFIYEDDHMPFVKDLMTQGYARSYVVKAHPPTVTLPRIKALTSGTIPGFIDVVLNFDSKTLTEDNFVTQTHSLGRNIVFYGDDTWVKLFPNHFLRSDGTTSFFVTDYTEVDNNVTRHIDDELSTLDWDLLILHYLGLDHIGHTVGPKSSLVQPKLQEMDDVIKQIYQQLLTQSESFLLLVCGDHGMSDQGSHGGASDREVLVPALFLSPSYRNTGTKRSSRKPLQIDLAATLSILMGTPVPANNLGQILLEALDSMDSGQKLDCLHINGQQILKLMIENVPDYEQENSYLMYQLAVKSYINYIKGDHSNSLDDIIQQYELSIESMSTKISGSLTTYDMYAMLLAMFMLCLCFISLSVVTVVESKTITIGLSQYIIVALILLVTFGHMTACTSQSFSSTSLCGRSFMSVFFYLTFMCGIILAIGAISNNVQSITFRKLIPDTTLHQLLLLGTLFHTLSFGSSSFVEEEHQTWYFLCMTVYIVVMVTKVKDHVVVTFTVKSEKQNSNNKNHYIPAKQSNENNEIVHENKHNDIDSDMHALHTRNLNNKSLTDIFLQLPWKQICGMFSLMCIVRCMRCMNQTGNKWLDVPDIGDWLISPENKDILTVSIVTSFCVSMTVRCVLSYYKNIIFISAILGCYGYRVAIGAINNVIPHPIILSIEQSSQGIFEARFVYSMILFLIVTSLIEYFITKRNSQPTFDYHRNLLEFTESLQNAWILVMFLLLRSHNCILVAMMIVQEKLIAEFIIKKTNIPSHYLAILCWWVGQASFFYQGNSNSMSSIDVSSGYIGLQDYNPIIVPLLLFSATYVGPIYWFIAMVKFILHSHIYTRQNKSSRTVNYNKEQNSVSMAIIRCVQTFILERLLTLLFYCIVVTSQRYHLFVWTVFSPKLFYEGMLNILISLFSCIILFTLS
ncbi:hypothetical protein ACF0H5_004969 [Mactra antiquata]